MDEKYKEFIKDPQILDLLERMKDWPEGLSERKENTTSEKLLLKRFLVGRLSRR